MVPPQFVNFFIASAGAGAALVGLLFVAVSIAPEHIVQANAPVERQAMAASSFTALLNAFFISFGALLPENVGFITLVMSLSGLINGIYLTRNLLKERQKWQSVVRRIYLILVSYIVYGFELYYAILLIKEPGNLDAFYGLTGLLIGVYGIGLLRAWQLLGPAAMDYWVGSALYMNRMSQSRSQPLSNPRSRVTSHLVQIDHYSLQVIVAACGLCQYSHNSTYH